uniref:hypothetical protein n=1 Tax=Arachnia propionica TaxID=1750 RepID=UPI0030C73004
MPLLEAFPSGIIWLMVFATAIGLLALRQGWVAYTEPTPRFVLHYNGWSCPPLAMLYGGIAMLIMGVFGPVSQMKELEAAIPKIALGFIGLAWAFCMVTFLLGFFFWFPPFLLPPWYHRARRAGIDRHDPDAMGTFKALPLEEQRQAARKRQR